MRIGIVILNWNGLDLLKTYLPSVVEHSMGHDIFLADNASTDDSVQWVKKTFKDVQIIQMDKNRGYAGGYNHALKHVSNEVVCLLNSDVRVTAYWCDRMSQVFIKESNIVASQPKILSDNQKSHFEYAGAAGGFIDRLAYPYCRGRIFTVLEKDNGQYDDAVDIYWASGACLFLRKAAFDAIGGFDNDYFAHQEEIDLCWRLRHLGHRITAAPDTIVYHLGGGTLSSYSALKTFYNFRNSLFNIVKNDHSTWWFMIVFLRMVLDGVAALKFLIEGNVKHFVAVFKAHISFYKFFRMIFAKRKAVQQSSSLQSNENEVFSIVYDFFIRKRLRYRSIK